MTAETKEKAEAVKKMMAVAKEMATVVKEKVEHKTWLQTT